MSITIADLKKVYRTTFEARKEWKNILLELEASSATIRSIEVRCHDDPKDCYREGLSEWLEGGERSWGDLVEALSSPTVGHSDIAMTIERNYIQSAGADTTVTSGRTSKLKLVASYFLVFLMNFKSHATPIIKLVNGATLIYLVVLEEYLRAPCPLSWHVATHSHFYS